MSKITHKSNGDVFFMETSVDTCTR